MKNKALYDIANPIAAAVLPLRDEAMTRAEQYAREIVASVREQLKAAGNDLNVAAPYPHSRMSRNEYMAKMHKYQLFSTLTKWREGSHRHHEPCFVDVDSNYVARFVKEAREDAAAQYDLFIMKLIAKIGDVETASLNGNHVWSYSFLTVSKARSVIEIWKTQQIMNVSKLGKVFAQWPTRKVKNFK